MFALLFLLYSLTFSVHTDQGPTVDPNGGRATVYNDEGSGMCPVGHRGGLSVNPDQGPAIDPNG